MSIGRRTLTKGQQAMALAMIYPNPEKGGKGHKAFGDRKVSAERISVARSVLRNAPKLADVARSGSARSGAPGNCWHERARTANGRTAGIITVAACDR